MDDWPATGTKGCDWQIRPEAAAADDPLLDCLLALARLAGRSVTPAGLTAGLPLGSGALTPDLVARAAARAGLTARLTRRSLDRLDALDLPCVLLLRERRACVLLAAGADACTILLPETGLGATEIPRAELSLRHTGHVVLVAAVPGAWSAPAAAADDHWFWSVVLRQWRPLAEVAVAAALINVLGLASPLFVMSVYDRVVPNHALPTLWVLAVGVVLAFGLDFVLRLLRAHFVDAAGRAADQALSAALFAQAVGLKLAHRRPCAGAFANELRELDGVRDFFTSASIAALVDLPFVGLFILVAWILGGWVAAVPAIAVPVVLAAGLGLQLPLRRAARAGHRDAARRHGVLVEALQGVETLKCLGAEGWAQAAWERLVASTGRSAAAARFWSAVAGSVTVLAANLVTVGVVIVGVHEIAAGRMTVGALIACSILAGRAMAPLAPIVALASRYHQTRAALAALDRVMRLPIERPPDRQFLHRPALAGALELRQVRFTYPGHRLPALDGVSLAIGAGERVGLIGRIGSGKSTLGRLLMGLYPPDEGLVLVDGIELGQIDPGDLRRGIGRVPQDLFLVQGSLRENLTLGAAHVSDEALLRAARAAGVDELITRHPLGLDLPVGERGEALSGGQRQAVAIARGLLLEPPILILDEPTSLMDATTEARFTARLRSELAGRALVMITHRLPLLALVDRVIVLDHGRVAADGPREEVLRRLAAAGVAA